MQIHHEFPCPMCPVLPNEVSLMGFYWNHKPLAGEQRLGEDRKKVELAQLFGKCDNSHQMIFRHV